MSDQFVVFATPCFDYNVTMYYHQSAMQTDWLLAERGIERSTKMYGGDPYLAKVRNLLVSTCLRQFPQMTDFFFIDADLEWDPQAVIRMLDHPADVIAGIYPKKNDVTEFPCSLMGDEEQNLIEKDGCYKAVGVPTGFLRIKRHVLEKMAAESPTYLDGTGGGETCWNIFEMGYDPRDGEWWGEDYAWCRRWREMGGDIWVMPDIDFGHRGGKNWRNNFGRSIEQHLAIKKAEATGEPVPPAPAGVALGSELAA